MGKKSPETTINDWCSFHLDDSVSRWPADSQLHQDAKIARNGFVYAGDGIRAALAKARYAIVPMRSRKKLPRVESVEVSINGQSKFNATQVDACTIERVYDGVSHTTTITIRHHDVA